MSKCVIASPEKREFVYPRTFGDGMNPESFMNGLTAKAVDLLSEGRWKGDKIVVIERPHPDYFACGKEEGWENVSYEAILQMMDNDELLEELAEKGIIEPSIN